jgi:hypothetical protein
MIKKPVKRNDRKKPPYALMKHPRMLIATYCLFLGISVVLMWGIILSFGDIPEGVTEMSFHLASEFIMAGLCLTGSLLLFRKHASGPLVALAGLSMALYSTLNAAGYCGERGQVPALMLFMVLTVLTSAGILVTVLQFSYLHEKT